MAENEILIKVKAQTQQAVTGLKGLAAALGALGVLEFGRRLAVAGAELLKFGLEVSATKTRLDLTVGSAKAADAYIRAIQESTNGAVDSFTAMNIALQSAQYGFASTPEAVGELARNILILSNGNAELANSFLYMASNGVGSIERLNEFGLSAANVRQRMDELQAANEGMTRDAAFTEAVFAELNDKAETLGGTMETNAAKVRKLGAAFQEIKVDAASAAEDGFGAWLGMGEQLIAMLGKVNDNGVRTENIFTRMQVGALRFSVIAQELAKGSSLEEALLASKAAGDAAAIALGAISTEASRAADETEALALAQEAEAEASHEQAIAAKQANAELLNAHHIVSELADETERLHRATIKAEDGALNSFDVIAHGIEDAGEAGQQGLKGLAAVLKNEDGKRYMEAFYQLAISDLDMSNPKNVAKALELKVSMGLATSQEVSIFKEVTRLIQLWKNGQLSSEQLAGAAGAAAGGDLGTLQGIQGSGQLDPNRPSAGGGRRPPDLSQGGGRNPDAPTSQPIPAGGPRSGSGGGAVSVSVNFQGVQSLDEALKRIAIRAVEEALSSKSGGRTGPASPTKAA